MDYLGSHGKFTALMNSSATLPKEEQPAAGKLINVAKVELEAALASRREELELKAALPKEPTDFTLPGRRRTVGKLHPLTQVTEDIVRAFRKIGFVVADGPEVEDEYHCFDALNTPADHPARDTQDTFYIETLRRSGELGVEPSDCKAPTSPHAHVIGADSRDGKAAAADPHHRAGPRLSPRQRGRHAQSDIPADRRPYVDKGVTVGDLKGTVEFVFKELLGNDVKVRFRPHYFSYTEPSFEIDFTSPLVKKMGKDWLEIAGCGMVHPQVFENVGYDPEVWTGWAFGFGIERIAMIRYGINDIRLFYENDVRFLQQF